MWRTFSGYFARIGVTYSDPYLHEGHSKSENSTMVTAGVEAPLAGAFASNGLKLSKREAA